MRDRVSYSSHRKTSSQEGYELLSPAYVFSPAFERTALTTTHLSGRRCVKFSIQYIVRCTRHAVCAICIAQNSTDCSRYDQPPLTMVAEVTANPFNFQWMSQWAGSSSMSTLSTHTYRISRSYKVSRASSGLLPPHFSTNIINLLHNWRGTEGIPANTRFPKILSQGMASSVTSLLSLWSNAACKITLSFCNGRRGTGINTFPDTTTTQ